MNDSSVLRIALCCSVAGLCVLFFISSSIEPANLGAQTDFAEKEFVKINGTIEKISAREGVYYIKVAYNSEADIVAFSKNPILFEEGAKVEVVGKTDEFNGKKQVIADRIRVIG